MTLDTELLLAQAEGAIFVQAAASAAPSLTVITFTLGAELYAVPLAEAREVARVGGITPVPSLPPALLGAMNLRGEILAVADLRPLLGLEPGRVTPTSRLVIVTHGGEPIGLLVDGIGDVFDVPVGQRASAPSDLIAAQTVLPDGSLLNLLDVRR